MPAKTRDRAPIISSPSLSPTHSQPSCLKLSQHPPYLQPTLLSAAQHVCRIRRLVHSSHFSHPHAPAACAQTHKPIRCHTPSLTQHHMNSSRASKITTQFPIKQRQLHATRVAQRFPLRPCLSLHSFICCKQTTQISPQTSSLSGSTRHHYCCSSSRGFRERVGERMQACEQSTSAEAFSGERVRDISSSCCGDGCREAVTRGAEHEEQVREHATAFAFNPLALPSLSPLIHSNSR